MTEGHPRRWFTRLLEPVRELGGRDPTMFLFAVAGWGASSCLPLFASPHTYETRPIYLLLRALQIPATGIGTAMALCTLALVWSLLWGPVWCRPAMTVLTAALWLFWGAMLTMGGVLAHVASSAGCFSLVCGTFSVGATIQWSGMRR